MGHRNPDRVSIRQRYHRASTVADMQREKWEVIAVCRTCNLMMLVDLRVIIAMKGPGASLWNRKARCRRLLCQGVVEFQAKAPGMTHHEPLQIDERLPAPSEAEDDRPEAVRALGLSPQDWQRIKALAEATRDAASPAALDDLDAPVRVGACPARSERNFSGDRLGAWAGRTLLVWRMNERERGEWLRRRREGR